MAEDDDNIRDLEKEEEAEWRKRIIDSLNEGARIRAEEEKKAKIIDDGETKREFYLRCFMVFLIFLGGVATIFYIPHSIDSYGYVATFLMVMLLLF
jgi:hypothetical protein